MLLIIHIVIALLSVVATTILYFAPNDFRFTLARTMVVATVASGSLLIVFAHASILRTCLSGLFYIGVLTYAIAVAQRRFAEQKSID